VGNEHRFFRFALVGGLGFVVDATVLTLLVNAMGYGHYLSRAVSFTLAVTVTWWINRSWVFRAGTPTGREYSGYFLVQMVGAVTNLGIYVLVIELVPRLAAIPVVPLAIGAIIAMIFNFLLMRRFVFRRSKASTSASVSQGSTAGFEYSGVENLEAMKQAQNYNNFLIDLVRRNLTGSEVLDFGAGAGTFAVPLRGEEISVACVEPDEQLRNQLMASGFSAYPRIDDVPSASVDCIYSLNVLEHIEEDGATLAALYDRLRDGGRVIIYVPAFNVLYSKMDELVGHHRRYRRDDLIKKMRSAGFRIDTARYVDSLGFFLAFVYRWIGNDTGVISPTSVKFYDRFLFPVSRLLDRLLLSSFGKNLLVVGTR
jgi:putative flippase GtrA/SAM-dependent methyltransferase